MIYSTTKKFNGALKDFKPFCTDVICVLQAQNRAAAKFLLPDPPYVKNADNTWTHVPSIYLTITEPDLEEAGLSQAERMIRGQNYDRIKAHNTKQELIFSILRTTIFERLAPNMLPHFATLVNEMDIYEYWISLPTLYGPDTMGHIAKGDLMLDTLSRTLHESELFAPTISQLEIEWTEANISKELQSAILFSDGHNKLKFQFLPPRFNSALQYIRTNNLTYDQAKTYLRVQDNQLPPILTPAVPPPAVIQAVQQKNKKKPKSTSPSTPSDSTSLVPTEQHTSCVTLTLCSLCDNTACRNNTLCKNCNDDYKKSQRKMKDDWIQNKSIQRIQAQYLDEEGDFEDDY